MRHYKRYSATIWGWLMALSLSALLAGCGGGGGGSVTASAPGTLGVSLTDAPACGGYDEVNVTVVKVRVHQSASASEKDAGWTDITLAQPRKVNLLDLNNGALISLGDTPLAAGHYTQIRLVLAPTTTGGLENSVLPSGGVETPLVTPSAVQTGIKLIHQFDVESEQRVDLMLDFDACKSVVKRGNGSYALKPVVKVIPFVLNGIDGFVDPLMVGNNVMVTAQQNGEIIQSSAPNTQTGEFFLGRLDPGNYDVVITADGYVTGVIANVPVSTDTSITDISTISAPITLTKPATPIYHTVSGTAVLNPTDPTIAAYVAAKQTFAFTSGTPPVQNHATVTVKFVSADDTSTPPGDYSLTLPADAPKFGQYSATLPITLSTQSALAGIYTIEASATGYTTQSVADNNVDLANQDFILVP